MKKGYTLVELLGVIVILGIIGLITVPVVQKTLMDSENSTCYEQIKLFEKAAKNYVSSNPYNENYSSVSLDELIKKGFLDESQLENPKGGTFSGTVKIEYNNGKYTFNYNYGVNDTNCDA